jgi:hypothetical protein
MQFVDKSDKEDNTKQWWSQTFYIVGVADFIFIFLSGNFYDLGSRWN